MTRVKTLSAMMCACLLSGFATGKEIPAETAVDDGFAACWARCFAEKTSLLYTFYANGKKVGEQNDPVSHVEQFVLVTTEPGGYRKVGSDGGLTAGRDVRTWGKPDPRLFDVVLPDFFEVDFVRVYDEASNEPENENPVRK